MNIKPNYFEKNEQSLLTPSNTPSNKIKGELHFNMNAFDNSKFIKNLKTNEDDEEDEEINRITKEFCIKILLGSIEQGHFLSEDEKRSCSKIVCSKCNSKVVFHPKQRLVIGYKNQEISEKINEYIEKDDKSNTYSCKCIAKSVSQESVDVESLGIDYWECDGHLVESK